MAVSNSLLGIYLKQISHVCDQVADFVNFYGFKETADSLERSNKSTTVKLSCNVTQELTETFNEYGYVTLGITWIPAVIYFMIFATLAAQQKKYKWIGVLNAFLSIPLAPLVPLGIGIILLFKNHSEGMINLVQLCGLVEASFEASLQVIWQGYIICSNQLPIDLQTQITFYGRNGNNLIIDHKTISYISLSTSILMSGFTSVTSFVEFSNIPNQKSDVLLIIISQAFKSLTYILLFSYLPWWYLGPVLFIIFMCNVFILHSAKVMKNDLLLFINALLNVPMLCFFNRNKFSPYSNTNEIGSEENPAVLNTQKSEEQRIEEEGNKDVDKKMIKWTNFILIISFTVTAVLVNFDLICYLKENVLTQYGKNYFNWVIVYGLLPLAFLSTLLSSSMRRKRRGRRLNKTKIILTLFSGFLVYFAATILVMYSNKNHFFSCNLTTVIPYNGPWEKLDQLSSIDTTELKELFSQDYLFGEDLWITLVGSMPVLLTLSGAVLFLLTLVLVFIEFGGCCGQYTFLFFFNLFLIIPVVAWTSLVVFPMGLYNEESNPLNGSMNWFGGGFRRHYSTLQCDPLFWKRAFWFVCLLCAFEVGIIVAIFLKFCKVTCRCLKICCCCCCESENSDQENPEIVLSAIKASDNADITLLPENNQENENQVQEPQTSNETSLEAENLLPKLTKKELKKLKKDKKKGEELSKLAAEAKAEAEAKAKAAKDEKEETTEEEKDYKEESETTRESKSSLIDNLKSQLAKLEAEAEVEAKDKAETEEQAKIEAEAFAKKEAEAKDEAEAKAKFEAEEKAKLEDEQSQVKPDDKKETETSKENKLSFLDNIKSIRILPSFLSKKQSKVKDVEAGVDKEEESKELLEKKKGGMEESLKEIKETPSEEPVPQSENDNAQKEENQSIQSPPVLSSRISIPLD